MNTDTTSHRVTEVRNWQTKYSERAPVYFHLDGIMYDADLIQMLRLDGGLTGFGCWGEIQLRGWPAPMIIGDGSYYMDSRHVEHLCAHDFNFKTLRSIMQTRTTHPCESVSIRG